MPEIYNDIWALTAGMGFPANERMTYKIGAMYVSEAVDDEPGLGRVAGENDDPWAVMMELTYHF